MKIKTTINRFLADNRGPTPVEWAAIAAVLITAITAAFPIFNNLLQNFMQDRVGRALKN